MSLDVLVCVKRVVDSTGEVVLTDQVFPDPASTDIQVFTEGGTAVVRRLTVVE